MTTRETGALASDQSPQGVTYQRQANHSAQAGPHQQNNVPHKWKRVLTAFLSGRSFHRFQAERPVPEGGLADHCLHSTVSEIQSKGVRISRKMEKVSGYQGIQTEVMRYWLDFGDVESVAKARELLGEVTV